MLEVTVLTWNVHGSHGLDVDATAAVIGAVAADVVGLQEVQRRQVAALADAVSMPSRRWAFKHWPISARAEGLAVLSPHRLVSASSFRLRWAPFWSWRRRIGIDATFEKEGRVVRVLDVHLSSHGAADHRVGEAITLVARAGEGPPTAMIVGDLNDHPDLSAPAALIGAGWIDAWAVANGVDGGATNWTPGNRVGRLPDQRLDYVFAPPGSDIVACAVPIDHERLDEVAVLSDHLPLMATVRLP